MAQPWVIVACLFILFTQIVIDGNCLNYITHIALIKIFLIIFADERSICNIFLNHNQSF